MVIIGARLFQKAARICRAAKLVGATLVLLGVSALDAVQKRKQAGRP